MRKIVSCVLAMVLLASAVPMAITPAAAYEKEIPFAGEDNELTKDELVDVILPYMLGEGTHTLDDVGDAAWVYAYWDGEPKRIVDSRDRTLTVDRPIERVVIVNAYALEILRSLKVQKDIIVGMKQGLTPEFFAFYPEFRDVPFLGQFGVRGKPPNMEKVFELHPDAAILFTTRSMDPTFDLYESAGIAAFCFQCTRPETHREEVEKLAYIFDKENEAEEYLDWYYDILNSIKEKVDMIPEEDKPTVYFEHSRPYTAYATMVYVEKAGGKDILPDAYGSVNPEAVVAQKPSIIVKRSLSATSSGYSLDVGDTAELEEVRKEIMNRDLLKEVPAVQNESVYIIGSQFFPYGARGGCRHFLLVAYQAKWYNSTLFEDLDPKAIHQEYLTRFQGLDIDLDKKGVFVYPEP